MLPIPQVQTEPQASLPAAHGTSHQPARKPGGLNRIVSSTFAPLLAIGVAWSCAIPQSAIAQTSTPETAQKATPPTPGKRFGAGPRLRITKQFDADGNGLLDAAERQEARRYLESRSYRPGGRGGLDRGITEKGSSGAEVSRDDVKNFANVPLYDTSVVRTIFLDFGFDDWEAEMAAFYNTDVEFPVVATIDGVAYRDVGVRFRGSSSFRRVPAGLKRPLRIKLDRVHKGQGVGGYRTLTLQNGLNDPTYLRTVLYSRIARNYIPAPRAGLVRIVINGKNWGIYPNQQDFNQDFIVEAFGKAGGVRWQVPGSPSGRGGLEYWGEDIQRYREVFEIDNRDRPESWQSLINLIRVLNETPIGELEAALTPILNIDGILRFLALDVALANSDGYWRRGSDYNIYLDPAGRFHVLPHDMNEALGTAGGDPRLDPLAALDDATKPLRSRLLAVPGLRARYLEYVLDIAQKQLDWDVLGREAQRMHALITDDVRRDTRKLYSHERFVSAFDGGAGSLKSFVEQRRAYLMSTVPGLIEAARKEASR